MTKSDHYEIFIRGETIDLALPSELAITKDKWHTWLNDPELNKYTGYGKIPNTAANQKLYLENILKPDSDRFALLILPKSENRAIGIVSLSSINYENRSAETAVIIGTRNRGSQPMYQGFEAKARITEHAFMNIGLERISGGQIVNLKQWQQVQLLFGFRPDGYKRNSYIRGHESYDSVTSSCLFEDYQHIVKTRQHYWPGKSNLFKMIKSLPKENIVDSFRDSINDFYSEFFKKHSLEHLSR